MKYSLFSNLQMTRSLWVPMTHMLRYHISPFFLSDRIGNRAIMRGVGVLGYGLHAEIVEITAVLRSLVV
jgi:hypothetical protein